MNDNMPIAGGDLAVICRKWRIRDLSIFGSAVRGELRLDSDLDILVSFDPNANWDLLELLHAQDDLEAHFGRRIDLVETEAVEKSDNWIVLRETLATAQQIYASA